MNIRLSALSVVVAWCFFIPLPAGAVSPPKIPGKIYVKTADGCGFLFAEDSSLTPEVLKLFDGEYWLGDCKHGLANGLGYTFNPSNDLGSMPMTYMQFGEDMRLRASVSPAAGMILSPDFGPEYTYALATEGHQSVSYTTVPVGWDIHQPYALPLLDGNAAADEQNAALVPGVLGGLLGGATKQEVALGSSRFSLVEGFSSGVPKRSVNISIDKRSCLLADKKIRGCHYTYDKFDIFGVLVTTKAGDKNQEVFTQCPDPKTIVGCGPVWRKAAAPHLDSIVALVKQTQSEMTDEQESLAKQNGAAEAALPSAWKQYWRSNLVDRSAAAMAMKCAEASDFRPGSLDNAYFIKQKYAQAPCSGAITAAFAVEQANKYIHLDFQKKNDRAAQREAEARARARRDQANQEAWAGFFNTTSAMLNTQIQIHQQRIDNTNAQIAASNLQQQSALVYQSYGQPLSPSAGQQSNAVEKIQTRKIHKPELDAGSCVKRAALASGDPLSSYGSQVFSNQCGQTVEVFWCKVGDECERGAGGSTTLGAGRSWPVTSGDYYYGACFGANSGALEKSANGTHAGRYACTGP